MAPKRFNPPIPSIAFSVLAMATALVMTLSANSAPPLTDDFVGTKISNEAAMLGSTSVFPDGRGLPEGKGTARQGKALYERYCMACHGLEGNNGINDRLAGGAGSLTGNAPIKTIGSYWPYATTLFDYIARAMPYNAPGSLNTEELYSVTAYLLSINNIIDPDAALDDHSLPLVVMPNRDGFDWRSLSRPTGPTIQTK